jgi:hypothetical protein
MISKEASGAVTGAGAIGGSATGALDFLGVLGENAAALGLIVSAVGVLAGIVFYSLNLIETRKQNRAILAIARLKASPAGQ